MRMASKPATTMNATARKVAEADFPTRWGRFRLSGFEGAPDAKGTPETAVARVIGDVFGSRRCDCRQQLEMALAMIAAHGSGVLVYEQQEGRGIGLMAKLQA